MMSEVWIEQRAGNKPFYAHSLPGRPKSEWQPLKEHLQNTANLAKQFADKFNAGDWGYIALFQILWEVFYYA